MKNKDIEKEIFKLQLGIYDCVDTLRDFKKEFIKRRKWNRFIKSLYFAMILVGLLLVHYDHMTIDTIYSSAEDIITTLASNAGVIVVRDPSDLVTDKNWD